MEIFWLMHEMWSLCDYSRRLWIWHMHGISVHGYVRDIRHHHVYDCVSIYIIKIFLKIFKANCIHVSMQLCEVLCESALCWTTWAPPQSHNPTLSIMTPYKRQILYFMIGTLSSYCIHLYVNFTSCALRGLWSDFLLQEKISIHMDCF